MYLRSYYGGTGRNLWTSLEDGTVEVRKRGRKEKFMVVNGILTEHTERKRHICTKLRYGKDYTAREKDRIVYQEFYQPNTVRAMRRGALWKFQANVKLAGSTGKVRCYSRTSGGCGKESFVYDNGTMGYIAAPWRKKFLIHYPDGKPWIMVNGSVSTSREPIATKLKFSAPDLEIWRIMRCQDWDLTIYDKDGTTILTQGRFKSTQKEGKWLEGGKVAFYMAGVRVSRKLFEEDPVKWNPHEVLRIPNAQLRSSLLNRFGYERLLSKVNSKIIDRSHDGGQLIEIAAQPGKDSGWGVDTTMRLLKVVCPSTSQAYVLRVPPGIDSFEQARQWTFGLGRTSLAEGALFDFVKET
jgi:hypothetical protein